MPFGNRIRAVKIPISTTEKLFDEISLAGEMVGFGIGTSFRLLILSIATILVVGLFSIFVFLHAVGRGLMKKKWDIHPDKVSYRGVSLQAFSTKMSGMVIIFHYFLTPFHGFAKNIAFIFNKLGRTFFSLQWAKSE